MAKIPLTDASSIGRGAAGGQGEECQIFVWGGQAGLCTRREVRQNKKGLHNGQAFFVLAEISR
ncbi:MAG: hypothetical protein ACOY41_09555 [Pseudomonadota bacterium]